MDDSRRQLLWHGMFLFLIGLLTGLVGPQFNNPRMGLAAHLEGVMNGTFLVALGAIWTEVRLSNGAKTAAYWSSLYGAYMNWTVTTLAAIWGTSAMTPIASAGHTAPSWQERLVAFGFVSVGLAMIASLVLILWGLRRSAPPKSPSNE
jgi:hydroxylaminobenzene mutase